jgi:hypothetical protein
MLFLSSFLAPKIKIKLILCKHNNILFTGFKILMVRLPSVTKSVIHQLDNSLSRVGVNFAIKQQFAHCSVSYDKFSKNLVLVVTWVIKNRLHLTTVNCYGTTRYSFYTSKANLRNG